MSHHRRHHRRRVEEAQRSRAKRCAVAAQRRAPVAAEPHISRARARGRGRSGKTSTAARHGTLGPAAGAADRVPKPNKRARAAREAEKMSEADRHAVADGASRPAPRLNERILSSLSRRSVAAHPWHDLDIGETALPARSVFRGVY
jgi:hypothetical protein